MLKGKLVALQYLKYRSRLRWCFIVRSSSLEYFKVVWYFKLRSGSQLYFIVIWSSPVILVMGGDWELISFLNHWLVFVYVIESSTVDQCLWWRDLLLQEAHPSSQGMRRYSFAVKYYVIYNDDCKMRLVMTIMMTSVMMSVIMIFIIWCLIIILMMRLMIVIGPDLPGTFSTAVEVVGNCWSRRRECWLLLFDRSKLQWHEQLPGRV